MLPSQARLDLNNEPIVLSGDAEYLDNLQIAANSGDLVKGAVLGELTASPGVYAPVADVAATDGTKVPKVILACDVADNVAITENVPGYTNGKFAEEQLVFGGAVTLDSVITLGTDYTATVRDAMRLYGLRTAKTVSVTGFENS